MTNALVPAGSQQGTGAHSLFQFWMLPAQIGMGLMESYVAMATSLIPMAEAKVEQAQDIAAAAEEQIAQSDDTPADMIPAPAALIA